MTQCTQRNGTKKVPEMTEDNDDLTIQLQRPPESGDVLVIRLVGMIDFFNSKFFGRQLRHFLQTGETRFVFDMGSLGYVSSTGIGELVGFLREVRMCAGRIALAAVPGPVLEVMSLLGFASFFDMADSTGEAVTRLLAPTKTSPFPRLEKCPVCRRKLRLTREGRFRCPECKTIVRVTVAADILVG